MLGVHDAEAALRFYQDAFGAVVSNLHPFEGKIGHAELEIEGQTLALADEFPEYHTTSPQKLGGSPVTLYLKVPDVDATTDRAVEHGAKLLRAPENAGHGERVAKVEDPFGHLWFLAGPLT
jgi:PhnB protein